MSYGSHFKGTDTLFTDLDAMVRTVLFGRKSIYSFTVIPYDGEKILQIWGQRQRFGFGRAYCPHQGF